MTELWIFKKFSHETMDYLCVEVKDIEMKSILFAINGHQALGVNGLTTLFY